MLAQETKVRHLLATDDELDGAYKPLTDYAKGPPPSETCSQAIIKTGQVIPDPRSSLFDQWSNLF